MKIHLKKVIFKFLIVFMLGIILCTNIYAAEVVIDNKTHDYSEINSLPSEYSYGTLFFTDNTKLVKIGNPTYLKVSSDRNFIYGVMPGEEISFKMTNCSIDKDGDMCDVLFTVNNVRAFSRKPSSNSMGADFGEDPSAEPRCRITLAVSTYPGSQLMHFWFSTRLATADYSMTYYKSGTNTLANVPYVVSSLYDFDVSAAMEDYRGEVFDGNEGTRLPDGVIYYDKKSSSRYIKDIPNGLGVCTPSDNPYDQTSANIPIKNSSAVVIQKTPDSKFNLTYSGSSCGIAYVFISPYTYELDNPTVEVSKSSVLENEKFNYAINQYIPNNYYANILSFVNNAKGRYTGFEITDQLDSSLTIDGNIVVKNESNKDVTSYFDITVDANNKVTAKVKPEYFNKSELYSHLYTINVPVYVKEGTGLIDTDGKISNSASTTAKYANSNNPENLNSNSVNIDLKYNVTINSKIENGKTKINTGNEDVNAKEVNAIAYSGNSSSTISFKPDYGYKLKTLKVDGEEVSIDTLVEENGFFNYTISDETIKNDIEHNLEVETELRDTSVVVNYIDENGNPISEPTTINGKVFDEYKVEGKEIYGYEYEVLPENSEGTMTEEVINVDIIYNRKDTKIVIKYIDEFGKTVGEPVTIEGKVFDEYETVLKNFDGFQIHEIPENAKGQMEEHVIEIVYVYTDISKAGQQMSIGSIGNIGNIGNILNTGDDSGLGKYIIMFVGSIIAGIMLIKKKNK